MERVREEYKFKLEFCTGSNSKVKDDLFFFFQISVESKYRWQEQEGQDFNKMKV